MNHFRNKAIQYIKILEEYDQADSLYDTSVYAGPVQPVSDLHTVEPSFSFSDQRELDNNSHSQDNYVNKTDKSTDQHDNNQVIDLTDPPVNVEEQTPQRTSSSSNPQPIWYRAIVNDAWDVVEKSLVTSDQVINSAWQTVEALGSSSVEMKSRTQHPSSSTNLVLPQDNDAAASRSKEAVVAKNPKIVINVEELTCPEEMRQPIQEARPERNPTKRLEPEETVVVQMKKKELMAKKRAERAKKKGLKNSKKEESNNHSTGSKDKKKTTDDSPSEKQKSPKKKTTGAAASPATAPKAKKTDTKTSSQSSTPKEKKKVHKHKEKKERVAGKEEEHQPYIEGVPRDPPGEPAGRFNDDATRASSYRRKKAHLLDPSLPSRQQKQHQFQMTVRKQQFKLQQPKCIPRHDLEELKPQGAATAVTKPWDLTRLPRTVTIPIPECSHPQQRSASPVPIRPCDIPRGSDMKKKADATSSFSAAIGLPESFFSQFGL